MEICDNGNSCGKGKVPSCKNQAEHWILTPNNEITIKLCNDCFGIALRAGLVTNPYLGTEKTCYRCTGDYCDTHLYEPCECNNEERHCQYACTTKLGGS